MADNVFTTFLHLAGVKYRGSFLTINMLVPMISKSRNTDNIRYEINSLKADEDVFKVLLKKQPHYEVSKDTSRILLGNPDSNLLITVFSNPHCNPCSQMHKRINKLLEQNRNICVQYIFSSFNEELEVSNKYLIGAYFQNNGESKMVYDDWFEKGQFNKEEFFRLHPVDIEMEEVVREFDLHAQWKEQSGLGATPTILVDGYKLPDNSKIEDIRYFTGDRI